MGRLSRLFVGHLAVLTLLLQAGCGDPSTSASPPSLAEGPSTGNVVDCSSLEPENPYDDDSGHDAGYKWAIEHEPASCTGNSDSFEEGCEQYLQRLTAYQACESRK